MTIGSAIFTQVKGADAGKFGFPSRVVVVKIERRLSAVRRRSGLRSRYEFDAPYLADGSSVLENGIDFFVKRLEEADDGKVPWLASL